MRLPHFIRIRSSTNLVSKANENTDAPMKKTLNNNGR